MNASDRVVPVISTSVTGPLGIVHLPRLWLKLLLHARGRLPEGYRSGAGGFDSLLCARFGIDGERLVAFVADAMPDYLAFEAWVEANATALTPRTIAAFNQDVRRADMPAAMATERRERFGIEREGYANAIALNDLDDWASLHADLVAHPMP